VNPRKTSYADIIAAFALILFLGHPFGDFLPGIRDAHRATIVERRISFVEPSESPIRLSTVGDLPDAARQHVEASGKVRTCRMSECLRRAFDAFR
jgi:hypothetical protein